MEDYVAQAMALAAMAKAKGSAADTYTKAQTDALLDGKADLVNGKIPSSELPSYVDDVVEYASTAEFPATGESGKIYIATDTNKTYRWGGSAYVEISESLALGETASTAYPGNKGKANADAIAAIKDGTNIDSFADVETALANIPQVTVDQTYSASSTNPQSGTAVAQAIITKVDKVTGKGLSENDYTNADKVKLDGIETGAEANVQVDWSQSDSTADDYIKNKPTIPTVNDATLTIQKNGTAVGTFSANAATTATINITVPVDAADVDAMPDTTKYGASLALSIDSSTYVVTATLKDQDGNTLGTAQTIDLPLETVVVGGSYDDTTKKVILTLKNGNTIDFSVADLVAGLQTEITSANKLDADLVDDTTSVHKFVTAADKTAWNAKSDFSGDYNDLTNKPTIPAAQVNADWNAVSGVAQILNKPTIPTPVTVDQTYDATSTNAQSGMAVSEAIGSIPAEVKKIFSGEITWQWKTTDNTVTKDFAVNKPLKPNTMYAVIIYDSGERFGRTSFLISGVANNGYYSTNVPIVLNDYVDSGIGLVLGVVAFSAFSTPMFRVRMILPAAIQTGTIETTSIVEVYEIEHILMNDGISADDYASQTIGGTVKAWTTTDGSDTILHLATQ